MAFFTAIGTISNDIVRRETKNGVVPTFRLETGAPRGRKLWIDIECWGHLAGSIDRHGKTGRAVLASGQLSEKVWRHRSFGERRQRFTVVAFDARLVPEVSIGDNVANSTVACGKLLQPFSHRRLRNGAELRSTMRSGRAGQGQGRLNIDLRVWVPPSTARPVGFTPYVAASGGLRWDVELQSLVLDCWIGSTSLHRWCDAGPVAGERSDGPTQY